MVVHVVAPKLTASTDYNDNTNGDPLAKTGVVKDSMLLRSATDSEELPSRASCLPKSTPDNHRRALCRTRGMASTGSVNASDQHPSQARSGLSDNAC
jgi:hypothetical protein